MSPRLARDDHGAALARLVHAVYDANRNALKYLVKQRCGPIGAKIMVATAERLNVQPAARGSERPIRGGF